MAERQTWHSFIPYTDRVDYLGGCAQNMPYVMAVEQLAGIKVPERAQVIRVMLNELFRINNHLLFCGTAIQDAGGMTLYSICSQTVKKSMTSLKRSRVTVCIQHGSVSVVRRMTFQTTGKNLLKNC